MHVTACDGAGACSPCVGILWSLCLYHTNVITQLIRALGKVRQTIPIGLEQTLVNQALQVRHNQKTIIDSLAKT